METKSDKVKFEEEYINNSRGLKLYTCRWIHADNNVEPKALVFICHGYAMECSITMSSTAIRLVDAGYGVYGIDYEGHGKSDGLKGFINNFDDVVNDCSRHFRSICEKEENKGKMRYLMGESMGGAMALNLHRKMPDFWDGAVLVAPMCKLADDMKPHPVVVRFLEKLCKFVPTWKMMIPSADVVELAFKDPEVRKQIRANKYCYKGKPRLKTGQECMRICLNLEPRLKEVSLPFLVLHGEEDRVTNKSASQKLHEEASSSDKELKLYPGMWHGLLYGEPADNIDMVFKDIISWLDKRTSSGNLRQEKEKKSAEDAQEKEKKSAEDEQEKEKKSAEDAQEKEKKSAEDAQEKENKSAEDE